MKSWLTKELGFDVLFFLYKLPPSNNQNTVVGLFEVVNTQQHVLFDEEFESFKGWSKNIW